MGTRQSIDLQHFVIRHRITPGPMFTLRCTQRLLRRIPGAPLSEDAAPTTLLGDWYANLLFHRPQQIVLCITERTLLPLIVPAKDAWYLIGHMAKALPELLSAFAIESTMIQRETSAMRTSAIGATRDRRMLGSLNELVFQLEHQLRFRPRLSLFEHSMRLAETPMGLIKSSPDRATQELFEAQSPPRAF